MKLLDYFKPSEDKNIVCLGRFDGLHLGHKTLIYKGAELRNNLNDGTKLAVFLFQRSEDIRRLNAIFTFRETIDKLKNEPVDNVIVAPETKSFYQIDRKDFLDTIKNNFNPKAIVCGEDYTFGNKRAGDRNYLKAYCEENGIDLYVMPIFNMRGAKVSSSRIRKLLSEGKVRLAAELLGEDYFIDGVVIKGRGDGKKLGFPTINIKVPPEKVMLKKGVYATLTCYDDMVRSSISNFGEAPTFDFDEILLETHITDGECDIYGKEVRIMFEHFIREDIKFDSKKALRDQIQKDIENL